jgi:hypothetical protein
VNAVRELHGQGVLTWLERELRFGLACAVVNVGFVGRHDGFDCNWPTINDDVVMACIRDQLAGWVHGDFFDAKGHLERRLDGCAVLRLNKEDAATFWHDKSASFLGVVVVMIMILAIGVLVAMIGIFLIGTTGTEQSEEWNQEKERELAHRVVGSGNRHRTADILTSFL